MEWNAENTNKYATLTSW